MNDSAPKRKFLDQLRDLVWTQHDSYDLYSCFNKGGLGYGVRWIANAAAIASSTHQYLHRLKISEPKTATVALFTREHSPLAIAPFIDGISLRLSCGYQASPNSDYFNIKAKQRWPLRPLHTALKPVVAIAPGAFD